MLPERLRHFIVGRNIDVQRAHLPDPNRNVRGVWRVQVMSVGAAILFALTAIYTS